MASITIVTVDSSTVQVEGTAADLCDERAKRLKDAGTPFERDGLTLRFPDPSPDRDVDVTLTYSDDTCDCGRHAPSGECSECEARGESGGRAEAGRN
jgi:hypothetical protein